MIERGKIKIAIVTNIIPSYREHFYDIVLDNDSYEIEVFCQSKVEGSNIKSSHERYGKKINILKSYSPFKSERLVIQFLPVFKLFKDFDILVVDGNLRHITQALLSTIFKIFGKKIVVWSNVYTFGGSKQKQSFRLKWWRIFDNFLMYTEKDVEELIKMDFKNKNILAINNGLNQNLIDNQRQLWNNDLLLKFKKQHNINSENIIISSGRVNIVNDHALTIEAIKIVKKSITDILWIVIGNGSELENLKEIIKKNDLDNNILLLGEIYEEDKKCPWFLISKAFVHSGPIGLSLFNAFGYSLPVITHDYFSYHGPEFCLFEDGKTGYLFQYKNAHHFASKILEALEKENEISEIRKNVYDIVKSKNNTNIMASQFFKMIKSVS
ncbi:glycosyltransferase [Flavobacterium sp. Fl-77]|uniref:Glycosyltransferase n=1 Tax=Flavobacterium flavipigmentatum TaxID=2893884 RepID=A0AAJ2SG68_9FLAO|nr:MULTISPECIES: glycosyltransferase [unclassified Flavobacterium]MDX6182206.1 glycosyltransferase [Flavobacterium sp. Fl-33]MDX6185881.1 glycosyltransferase [Flavobacterium sp. Fl-77]UFH39059.1 glycosyltransferase [Flavobacterium sp. F-70]